MMPLAMSNKWDGSAHAMLVYMMIRGYHYLPKGSMSPAKSTRVSLFKVASSYLMHTQLLM